MMVFGHPVEILAMEEGDSLGTASALVTFSHANYSEEPVAILFTQEQVTGHGGRGRREGKGWSVKWARMESWMNSKAERPC